METQMKKSQNKMQPLQPNELTMYQQIAAEGEVAMLYNNCSEAELACRTFEKLASVDKKLIEIYKSVMLDYVDEELIDTCMYHVHTETIPVYMYANRYAEEVMSLLGYDEGSMRVMYYPVEAVKSKFVQAMRILVKYLPITGVAILDQLKDKAIQSKSDLDFLLPIIFALKNNAKITEADVRLGGKSNPEDDIRFFLKIKILMDTTIGQMSIMLLSNEIKSKNKGSILDAMFNYNEGDDNNEDNTILVVDDDGTDEDEEVSLDDLLDDLINNKRDTVINEHLESSYVVKKIDSATGKTVMKWEFNTRDEAMGFVKDTHTNYPEVTKRYHFMVELVEVDVMED